MATRFPLLRLPSELIDQVLSDLHPVDLEAIAATCRRLKSHASKDLLWQQHVQDNVPGCVVESPSPCRTFQELYFAHDPYWFLTKYKIWFSDFFLTGRFILARYDPRRGSIDAYRFVAERKPTEFDFWEGDEVVIHSFEPKVQLHMDQPVLQLAALSSGFPDSPEGRFGYEIRMSIVGTARRGHYSNFFLARRVDDSSCTELWPPSTIPARHRVRNESENKFRDSSHRPQNRSEISDQTFRIRGWMEMRGEHHQPPGARLGEDVFTYSTLDPALYTPTADKPWRGIWIGDYAGHGCEFLLMHQPDDEVPFDEGSIVQRDNETPEEYLSRKHEERIYRGRIEAVKLTGDPNIPRGEYTFIAEDIGQGGFIRRAEEAPFKGARIVHSRGHVAETMFMNDKYIVSQLIMISPDKLAQHWVGFRHISFFERVNIDEFTSPF